jgi:ABC-type dipeptide/oligopeptide/nickel transport system permease subunit
VKFLAKRITGNSLWSDAMRRLLSDRIAVVSLFIVLVFFVISILTQMGIGIEDWKTVIGASREAPSLDKGWRFWLGTDIFGRSMLLKALHGSYTALFIGVMSSVISIPIGMLLGAIAGYFGGWIDELITWLYTTVSNIPEILLLVAISFAIGSKGIIAVTIALGTTTWVSLARLIRGEVIKHKHRDYVVAAGAVGGSHFRRLFIHITPNVLHILMITFSLRFVTAIKSEVLLTYLGLGVRPGEASWGLMIDDAKSELVQGMWWGMAGATILMFLIVIAFSLLADAMRDAFDPKLRT